MRTSARDALSVAAGLSGLAVLWAGLDRMLDIGSCTSGGPYIGTRTCPSGTPWWTALVVLGVMGWSAGMALSRQGLSRPGPGQLLWAVGFAGLGIAGLVKAATQESMPADARLGVYTMAAVFIPIGLGTAVAALLQHRATRRAAPSAPSDSPATVLRRLRDDGAVTREEYKRLRTTLETPETLHTLARLQHFADEHAAGRLTAEAFTAEKRAALW